MHPFFKASPHIMGIVNVTPDSFSDGGRYYSPHKAIDHALTLISQGADSVDIGGESTRPGSVAISPDEEMRRIIPVIEGLHQEGVKHISVDTRYPQTMEAAIRAGASVVNDINGLIDDPEKMKIVAKYNVPVVVMHMQGQPSSMQDNVFYNNVLDDIFSFFKRVMDTFGRYRIETNKLIFDPGVGFGKNDEHNLLILRNIKDFSVFGVPLLLGTSRKSFIGRLSGDMPVDKRIGGSISSVIWGLEQGVQFFRVHDVAETKQAFDIYNAIKNAK